MRVLPPQVVDAYTISELPDTVESSWVVVDLGGCRVFGADGYAWLGRLLCAGHRVQITGEPSGFHDRVGQLVPAVLAADGGLSL